MNAYRVTSDAGIDAIERTELPDPKLRPGEVLIRVRATSLNYRDLIVAQGGYPRNETRPVIPLSDGAGEVVAVGEGVTRWKEGDRVAANFMRDWIDGGPTETGLTSGLGGGIDGMLAELAVLPERSIVRIPEHLSFAEGATLPCAALTAWNALFEGPGETRITAGDIVLLLGTGGVSIFGLQLAKAAGARAIITSSSDDKLAQARELGADETINYREHEDWDRRVLELTAGRGVDHVVEVGGVGTFERSMRSTRIGGTVSLIGLLTQGDPPSILGALLNAQTIRGIYVGSVAMFERMNRAVDVAKLRPVIDRAFGFGDALDAYRYFSAQKHVGKVVIEHD